MTMTLLLNSILAVGVVAALAVVCRIPYRLVSVERLEEGASAVLPRRHDRERLAA
jgi:hypothetical protein